MKAHIFEAIISFILICIPFTFIETTQNNQMDIENCSWNDIPLHGKVQFVESFPDIKIQIVESFPDLKVKYVDAFPDDCGEWKIVESFPDFKVQLVESFPDIKIKIVESFPGVD